MICILKTEQSEITGWIIATDLDDARIQADAIGERGLAAELYGMYDVKAGKYTTKSGYTLLVSYCRKRELKMTSKTSKDYNSFGYQSDKPCVVCGSYKNNQCEPRFGYTVCIEHQSEVPSRIRGMAYVREGHD